jgi:competence ComEA-like helix-hairpin-helix protein
MSAKATNLALSDELVDLNEADANQLQSLLPGIGNVLASRIVAYREEHGPFENPTDLTKVNGIGEKLLSKLAPRLSMAPSGPYSGYSVRSEGPTSRSDGPDAFGARLSGPDAFGARLGGLDAFGARLDGPDAFGARGRSFKDDNDFPSVLSIQPNDSVETNPSVVFPSALKEENDFFESGDLRSPGAPDLESLLLRGNVHHSKPTEAAETAHESLRLKEPFALQEIETANGEVIPLHRPWRAWGIAAGIALFSAAVGSIYGIRSQEGGPRAGLERQVVRTQDQVADLQGSVQRLEKQSDTFASSINALDARISGQEPARPTSAKRTERTRANAADARPPATAPSKTTEVRENVRQALRTLDTYLDDQPPADHGAR